MVVKFKKSVWVIKNSFYIGVFAYVNAYSQIILIKVSQVFIV